MTLEEAGTHAKPLVGRQLRSVEKRDYSWCFGFGTGVSLATESPWRFIEHGRIVVSSEDHGKQFGLPAPVDAARELLSRAAGRPVEAAWVAADSGDLMVQFPGQVHLQLLQLSTGYESWILSVHGSESICMGGGNIAHFPRSGVD